MVSYHYRRLGCHSIEIWGELLDHYACPLPRGAQLTALSFNSARVQDVNKVSLLVGPGIDFQAIIPLHPLLGSLEPPPGHLMGGLQRLFKVHHVGLSRPRVPPSGGRVEEVGRSVDLQLVGREARVPFTADRKAPAICARCSSAVLCLVDIAPHRIHEGAVVPLHLAIGRQPIRSGVSLVNLEQLADSTEKLALEIPPLVRENLEGAPKTREEIIERRRGGNISRLGGQGDAFRPLGELVHHHQEILTTAGGQGSQKI